MRRQRESITSTRVRVRFPSLLVRLLPLGRIPPQPLRHAENRLRIAPIVDRLSARLDEVDAYGNVYQGSASQNGRVQRMSTYSSQSTDLAHCLEHTNGRTKKESVSTREGDR